MTRHRLEDQMLDKISALIKERDSLSKKVTTQKVAIDSLLDHIHGHCCDPECRLAVSDSYPEPVASPRSLLGRKPAGRHKGKSDPAKSTEEGSP